uniref:DHHW family protein n=1 Tax=Dubosiella newyorkensis TaxID=1862672 RepID=UPI002729C151
LDSRNKESMSEALSDLVILGETTSYLSAPNEALMSQKAQTIQAFHARFPLNTSVMIVPTAAQIDQDKLPPFAPGAFEQQTIDSFYSQLPEDIHALDVGKTLEKNQNKYQYYKTDHHWTSLGAYHAAKQFLKSQGMEIAYSDYERMPVSNSFRGTLESKTGSVFLKDTIDIYVAKNNPDYLVTYNNDGNPVPTIYDDEALHRKDQYEVFFGGNDSLVQINLNTDSTRHLLIFKDSYANSMIQFLLPYYRSITIVDPRYYYDDITRLIESDMITDVLFLYNYNSFQTDTSLLDVLNSANHGSEPVHCYWERFCLYKRGKESRGNGRYASSWFQQRRFSGS